MADVITRFKLETSQYDSKLRDSAKSLAAYSKQAEMAGKDFDKFSQGGVNAAKALGNMATSANNTKDKVKELVSAYNDVAKAYNNLTEEQKKSDFGKAMSESLNTLQGRIREAKAEMNDTGGILGKLTEKFTVNIDAIKLFSLGLQGAQAALGVAKDAFFASEATVDEWGRVMDSSKSLYEGFLTSLNTGDISGYLSRIDSIVQAARAAYNELDRLGTMKTIQAPQMSAQQTENERMRMMIQTGRYIAPVDGRRASMQNGQLLTPDQIKRIEQQLQGGMQKVVTLVGNEVAQTGRAIDAVYNRQAQELGMSLKEFRKGTSSMAEFDKRMAGYDQYQKWRQEHTTIDIQSGRETVARGNPFEQFAKWGTFRVDGDRYNDLVKLIQQRDQQAGSLYGMQSQAYRTMNRAEGVTLRQLMGGGSGGGGGRSGGGGGKTDATELQQNQQTINTLTQEYVRISDNANEETRKRQDEIQKEIQLLMQRNNLLKLYAEQAVGKLQGGLVMQSNLGQGYSFADVIPSFDEIRKHFEENPIKIPVEVAENSLNKTVETAKAAAAAVSSIGQAFMSIEDPAARVAGLVAQAIGTVALAYAQALSTDWSSKSNIYSFIAAAAASTASMIATIASIHNATGYAQGGVVKGNSYSGDNIIMPVDGGAGGYAGLNAGEVVLSKSMQSNLANQLQGGGGGGWIVGVLKGENMYLMMNRYTKRSGKGEIVTWGG